MTRDLLNTIGQTLGVILALPALLALIKLTRFLGSMESTIATTAVALKEFIARADRTFEQHNDRLVDGERQLAILWDGRERRKTERSKNDGGAIDA